MADLVRLHDFDAMTGQPIAGADVDAELDQILARINEFDATTGKSIIATEESRTNTAYGLMPTPDRVPGVVLPQDGLIVVAFQALWKRSIAAGGAKAAIFLGSDQVKLTAITAPAVQELLMGGPEGPYRALATSPNGLADSTDTTPNGHGSHVTTGQILSNGTAGGVMYIFAAAGTYDVSIQFKSALGSVTVKERKLWVRAVGY